MKIKILAVGSSKWDRFIRRWGVSFLIDEDVLFDTFGDPGVLVNNIKKFNIDIAKIKHIVLSHDDWDHIAGLWYLIDKCKDATVYICPGFKKEIKDRIFSFGVRVAEVSTFTMIKEDIFSTGQIEFLCADRIIFEQALVIRFPKNLAIVTGCSHPGIVNIIKIVKEYFQEKRVHFILGGLHLKDNADETNRCIISDMRELGVRQVAPMHCTGKRAVKDMREAFGYGFVQAREGDSIEL